MNRILFSKAGKGGLIAVFVILTGLHADCQAQTRLVKKKISKEIAMKIPANFIPMSEADMWQRVSSYRKSIALFTDMQRIMELGVNHAFSTWEEGDLEMLQSVYKASILQLFDTVRFSREEIRNIKGRDFAVFEFVSNIKGNPALAYTGSSGGISKYYYLQYTLYDKGTLVFNFSCPARIKDEWQPVAREIMNSVMIK
ncbi:MAG: hypothetical protein IH947_09300 [Bacteroidetes bacterium]|nr:hypothetical protein [Bacteroidota bacterium]